MAKEMDLPSALPALGLHALAKNWWLLLLRGIAAIAFGVLAFLWPGITLLTLVLLYGAFMLVDGVFALAGAIGRRHDAAVPTWWLVLTGVLDIAVGLIALLWPGITAFVLIIFIGAWAIVRGVFEIIAAIQMRKEIEGEWLLITLGAFSVLFGLALLIMPGAGALALIWIIGIYSIIFGGLLVGFALRLKKHNESHA